MNFLDEIYRTFLVLSIWLASPGTQGQSEGLLPRPRMSELNDYAFFVLLFAQLENRINADYEQCVGPWEQVAFAHRVHVLLGKGSEAAAWILDYYRLRCDIAHGHAEPGQMDGTNPIYMPKVYDRVREFILP